MTPFAVLAPALAIRAAAFNASLTGSPVWVSGAGRGLGFETFAPGRGLAVGRGLGFAAAGAGFGAEPEARLSLRVPGRERGRFPSNPGSSLIGR